MSALPKADIHRHDGDVRFVPQKQTSTVATATSVHSPDLNPIDRVFAKLKHLLLKAAARSAEAIGEILRAFTPTECANYFRSSGCAQS
jgi:transposase